MEEDVMKKSVKKLLVIAVMVMLTLCCSTTAQAKATRKKVTLTVNKTYAGAKKVKGKVTVKKGKIKGYKVKAQIAKKNKKGKYKYKKKVYTAKVNKKAKYTIKKMPKLKKGWKIRVKLYKGKKKVKTKVIKVKAKKSVTKGNYEPEITMAYYNRVMNDVDRLKKAKKAGGDITESMGMLFISRKATKSTPGCLIRQDGTYGMSCIGDWISHGQYFG